MTAHISKAEAGAIFIALPLLVAIVGAATFRARWRSDPWLRNDVLLLLDIGERQVATILLAVATLLGAVVAAAAVLHVIVG